MLPSPASRARAPRRRLPARAALAGAALACLTLGCDADPGWDAKIEGPPRARPAPPADAAAPADEILFGDLHVHSSYSWDGFLGGVPLLGGEGAHPPADACDFARWCSDLDFFALTDHAESMLPENWAASKQSIRDCNASAGDPAHPDLVAFMGFEWSQVGATPAEHFGHRNVIFAGTAEEELPARPIAAEQRRERWEGLARAFSIGRWLQPWGWNGNTHYLTTLRALVAQPVCPSDVDVRALPPDCLDVAPTPRELREKLDQWGFPALEIPHGMTWGTYTPANTTLDKHLAPEYFDPERMKLIEVMSGHGNSEQYRPFRDWVVDAQGQAVCPAPTRDFLPCCWQAGEIIRKRCGDLPADECERRVALAREYAMHADIQPQRTIPDAAPEEWLDCDQCRDCFKPAYGYRPGESVQYAMTLREASPDGGEPLRFRYGFIASSDNHTARAGTGYKQLQPTRQSDTRGSLPFPTSLLAGRRGAMEDPRMPVDPAGAATNLLAGDQRVTSFLYPGGLAAVHAHGRSREAIWAALQRREVYGTSGPHILLSFDLLNGEAGRAPMGSEHALAVAPEFEVRAVGSAEPLPGCGPDVQAALSPERIARLCGGECRRAGDVRRPIVAIEVVRIRPRATAGEAAEDLIEDPWRRFACDPDPAGCSVRFRDDGFPASGRDALYYVRALEAPSQALNGDPLSPQRDAEGNVVGITVCDAERVDAGGCPAPVSERAWSSPIYVDQPRSPGST